MRITQLTDADLVKLRQEITLNSVFLKDYTNTLGIDPNDAYTFFDGYVEYLEGLMALYGHKGNYQDILKEYDNEENLKAWRDCVACGEIN